jgi:hypothetical protein
MWYKDTPGQQDKRTTDNKGFTGRKKLTTLSNSVEMMGKLHLDVFCQDKYLLNSAVRCIAVYTGNDESLWQLSQKHIVLNLIHVAGGYRVQIMPKETPCLELISHPTCLKLESFS